MKIGLAQMRVIPGRPEKNIQTMRRFVEDARSSRCDLVAFPEMCISGYLLGDHWLDESFCRDLMTYNEDVRVMSGDIAVLYGNVYIDPEKKNKDGRIRKYNAAYAWYQGKPMPRSRPAPMPDGVTYKTLLPNYRIFDDERYFYSLLEESCDQGAALEDFLAPFQFTVRDTPYRIAVEICEDLWFNDYSYDKKPLDVSRMYIANGAECIVNLSASPWTYGKDRARHNRIQDAKKDCGRFVPFYYVNCTGVQNNGKNFVSFDGGSTVYTADGGIAMTADIPYQETLLTHTFGDGPAAGRQVRTVSRPEAFYNAAVEAIRALDETMNRAGYPFIIGLSGGIDSAVVASLVSQAVGGERVRLFNLPTKYNSNSTRQCAAEVAGALRCSLEVIPIGALVEYNQKVLQPYAPNELHCENIQAKIRGSSILSNLAGILGGVMTNNGNKVEIAMGYATLYGDVNGAIAPIGDLLKTEVFELARYLNAEVFASPVIPDRLIPDVSYVFEVPPTAELKPDQRDPMKWGYHDALIRVFTDYRRASPEDILSWYHDGNIGEKLGVPQDLLVQYGLTEPKVFIDDLEWVVRCMRSAVFKRVQSPPVVIMSKGAYGYDVRESQFPHTSTRRYLKLREVILTSGGSI